MNVSKCRRTKLRAERNGQVPSVSKQCNNRNNLIVNKIPGSRLRNTPEKDFFPFGYSVHITNGR